MEVSNARSDTIHAGINVEVPNIVSESIIPDHVVSFEDNATDASTLDGTAIVANKIWVLIVFQELKNFSFVNNDLWRELHIILIVETHELRRFDKLVNTDCIFGHDSDKRRRRRIDLLMRNLFQSMFQIIECQSRNLKCPVPAQITRYHVRPRSRRWNVRRCRSQYHEPRRGSSGRT